MAELDKWQRREARQYAEDNGVTYEEAVAALHPVETNEPPAEPEAEVAEAPAPKVSTSKTSAK